MAGHRMKMDYGRRVHGTQCKDSFKVRCLKAEYIQTQACVCGNCKVESYVAMTQRMTIEWNLAMTKLTD